MAALTVSGICRITRDAEEKKTTSGSWWSFSVAAYRKNVKEGKQAVDFYEADVYIKREMVALAATLKKGNLIYLENASLRNDQFLAPDGSKRNKFKILIMGFEVLNEKLTIANEVTSEPSISEDLQDKEDKEIQDNIPLSSHSHHPSDLPPPMNIPSMIKYSKKSLPLAPQEVRESEYDEDPIPF